MRNAFVDGGNEIEAMLVCIDVCVRNVLLYTSYREFVRARTRKQSDNVDDAQCLKLQSSRHPKVLPEEASYPWIGIFCV